MNPTKKRGGARVRTQPQVNSTTKLLGISFRWMLRSGQGRETPQAVICIAVGERRLKRGVAESGVRKAMRAALKLRRDAGLAVPTLEQAVATFEEWRRASSR